MVFRLHPIRDFFDRVLPLDDTRPFRTPDPGPRLVLVDANVLIGARHGDGACLATLRRLETEGRLATTTQVRDEVHATLDYDIELLTPGAADPVFVEQYVGNGKRASDADLSLLQAALEHRVTAILTRDSDLLFRAVTGIIQERTGRTVRVLKPRAYQRRRARHARPHRNPTTVVMPRTVSA